MPTPKVARNLGTLTFHRYRENRRISTIRFQTLKYTRGNYVRHFWGTTPATPAARDGRHNSTRGATPVTRRHTPYVAPHPLRGTAPVTRQCTRYGALHPIRRGVMPTDRVQRPQSQEQTRNLRDDRRHAQGPGSSRSRGPQHSAITSQHSTIDDPSPAFSDHQPAFNNRRSVVTSHQSAITNHQSPISSQQPLHNCQSPISRRSRWRRRGRPRR